MFDGRYDSFRAEGGSLGKLSDEEAEEQRRPRKMKHISDDDWKKETKKFGHNDRKPTKGGDRKFSKDRKPFDRDKRFSDHKAFEENSFDDRKPIFEAKDRFHGERKFEKSGNKPFDRDRKPFDRDRKPYERKPRPAVETSGKGPSIPESDTYRFSEYKLRSRRKPAAETDE